MFCFQQSQGTEWSVVVEAQLYSTQQETQVFKAFQRRSRRCLALVTLSGAVVSL